MLTDHSLKKDVGPEGTRSLGERRGLRGLGVRERDQMWGMGLNPTGIGTPL